MITNPELAHFIPEETPEAGIGSHPDDQPEQEQEQETPAKSAQSASSRIP